MIVKKKEVKYVKLIHEIKINQKKELTENIRNEKKK